MLRALLMAAVIAFALPWSASAGQSVRDYVRTGEALRVQGNIRDALTAFRRAVAAARPGSDAQRYAWAALGALQADEGLADARSSLLYEALGLQRGLGAEPLEHPFEIVAMAHLARVMKDEPQGDALAYANRAADAARLPLISAFAHYVLAEVRIARGKLDGVETALSNAWAQASATEGAATDATLLGLAETALDAMDRGVAGAAPVAQQALARVAASPDARLRAEGVLLQARMRAAQDPAAALELTEKALVLAQTGGHARTLFRVAHTRARLAQQLRRADLAARAYNAAFGNLQRLRQNMHLGFDRRGRSVYRREAGVFHARYIEFMLAQPDPDLGQVIRVSEDLKAIEVEEYFRAECRRGTFEQGTNLFGKDTAVLYPVILDDRLEMLVISGTSIRRAVPVQVTRDELTSLINTARQALEGRAPDADSRLAALYDRVFRSGFDALERIGGVENVVYIADGVLRNFPLGALRANERYLVQDYVFASALGMTLRSSAEPFDARDSLALIAGAPTTPEVAERPLKNVGDETLQIAGLFDRHARIAERRVGDEFKAADAADILRSRPYNVIHISAHAWFDGSSIDARGGGGFIGLADRGLSVSEFVEALLQRGAQHSRRVDLVVLSACGTASDSSDRAPLGIAGAAYRSNVASVVATLWPVYDVSADRISRRFYLNLLGQQAADPFGDEVGRMGRARALAMAQRWFIEKLVPSWNTQTGEDWSHPAYWSPFVLIGEPDF